MQIGGCLQEDGKGRADHGVIIVIIKVVAAALVPVLLETLHDCLRKGVSGARQTLEACQVLR